MQIELIYSPGCENLEIARDNLQKAIERSGIAANWNEINLDAVDTPVKYREYGSPTILINGRDVADEPGVQRGGT